jgi:putative nucleotidyltransferase with HDIG domain
MTAVRGAISRLLGHEGRRPAIGTVDGLVALAEQLDSRDVVTARHSRTVGRYAGVIARELGLGEEAVDAVHLAGLLHDIGKLGIDGAILNKPGPLTGAEWRLMREHPGLGAEILAAAGRPDLGVWVRAHHERPDGGGYPDGLAGEEIALEARILAVADSYEAMTNDCTYRRAIRHEQARLELYRHCGTQFDSAVVEAFTACGAATRIGFGRCWSDRHHTRPRIRWS